MNQLSYYVTVVMHPSLLATIFMAGYNAMFRQRLLRDLTAVEHRGLKSGKKASYVSFKHLSRPSYNRASIKFPEEYLRNPL